MTTVPVPSGPRAPSTWRRIGGALQGCGCAIWIGLVCMMCGLGVAAVPVVGWIGAVGLVGAGLLFPFVLALAGYMSPE